MGLVQIVRADVHVAGRRPWLRLGLGSVIAGLALGGANSLSNVFGSRYGPHVLRPGEGIWPLEVLAAVLGTAWAWSLVAFGVGWWTRRAPAAAIAGVGALLVADLTYYISDFAFGLNDELAIAEIAFWGVLALVVGSVMGLLGALAHHPAWWSIVVGLAAPAVIAGLARHSGSEDIRPWPLLIAWGLAAALTVCLVARGLMVLRARPTPSAPS